MDNVRCLVRTRRIREEVADLGRGHGRGRKSIVLVLTADGDLERQVEHTRFVMFTAFELRFDIYTKSEFRYSLIHMTS